MVWLILGVQAICLHSDLFAFTDATIQLLLVTVALACNAVSLSLYYAVLA